MHEECLNELLADSCSCPSTDCEGYNEYYIALHCSAWIVTAKPMGNFKYEVKSWVRAPESIDSEKD